MVRPTMQRTEIWEERLCLRWCLGSYPGSVLHDGTWSAVGKTPGSFPTPLNYFRDLSQIEAASLQILAMSYPKHSATIYRLMTDFRRDGQTAQSILPQQVQT